MGTISPLVVAFVAVCLRLERLNWSDFQLERSAFARLIMRSLCLFSLNTVLSVVGFLGREQLERRVCGALSARTDRGAQTLVVALGKQTGQIEISGRRESDKLGERAIAARSRRLDRC